jgi:hypothetical protein
MMPQPAQRGGNAKSSAALPKLCNAGTITRPLSPRERHRTSRRMPDLFDMHVRSMRRDRAARIGPELFLLERAFEDCLERAACHDRTFDRALLIGCPDADWPKRLGALAQVVDVRDPGSLFAAAGGGATVVEDAWEPEVASYDLVLAVGTLDTINGLPLALALLRYALRPNGLLLGVVSGGDTLPALRAAMRAADAVEGGAAPHVHPRIEAAALAPLLEQAGFVRPVVDVDRVQVTYPSPGRLVGDLRAMAATNVLVERPRRISRAGWAAAAAHFASAGVDGRTTEYFDLLHFAAWAPAHG